MGRGGGGGGGRFGQVESSSSFLVEYDVMIHLYRSVPTTGKGETGNLLFSKRKHLKLSIVKRFAHVF